MPPVGFEPHNLIRQVAADLRLRPRGPRDRHCKTILVLNTRGSQKVPGNVVYQCNGWTYDNAYLITFKVGPLRTHTHLLHRSYHCWKHRRKASFGIFRSSAVAFHLMSSTVGKRVPLRPIFRVGNSQKSLGERSGDYGGWVMTGMLFSARNCCTTSDVWLGAERTELLMIDVKTFRNM